MKENIGNVEYASLLYDFYGELLDAQKREVMDLYHEDDMSLAEIAEERGMTRQGVHYTLKKAEAILEKFEEKLGLVAAHAGNRRRAKEAAEIGARLKESAAITERERQALERLLEIIEELTE